MGDGFKPAPVPDNEAERLREVSVLGLTGVNPKDPHLNDIIQITCAVADTPIAMVNILDRPDQYTLQSCGVPEAVPTERPIEGALCQFVLAQGDVLIIEDLRTDERTREHPFINPPMSLRFYAGAPLVSASGYIVGTLCVMAPEPKTLDPRAIDALRRLADQAIRLLQGGPPRDGGDVVAPAKEKTPVRGQFHSQASILFTDFVGFTRHTEALEPAVLLETLARYFGAFDKICERFDLTRIKNHRRFLYGGRGHPGGQGRPCTRRRRRRPCDPRLHYSGEQRPRRLGGVGLGSPHRRAFRPSHRRQPGRTWHRHLG